MNEANAARHASPLAPGDRAPDFELPATPDQRVMLSEFRGQPVILVFYPEDRSPVCSDQLGLYQAVLPSSRSSEQSSSRSPWTAPGATWPSPRIAICTSRWLADVEPKGEVA